VNMTAKHEGCSQDCSPYADQIGCLSDYQIHYFDSDQQYDTTSSPLIPTGLSPIVMIKIY